MRKEKVMKAKDEQRISDAYGLGELTLAEPSAELHER